MSDAAVVASPEPGAAQAVSLEPGAAQAASPEPGAAQAGAVGRVLRGTAALGLVALINIVGQLGVVPVAMAFWGASRYGEWVALTALVTSLTLADLGIQTYVVNRMCAHHARGDIDAFLFDMHSALRVQIPLALALLTLGALTFVALPASTWTSFQTISGFSLYLTILFLGAEILFWVPMGVVGGTYRATGRLARSAFTHAVMRVGQFILPIGLIALRASFPLVACALLSLTLLTFAWIVVDLHRLYPWFRLVPLGGELRLGARMLGPGSLFLLASLSDYVALQGTIMVLQSRLGGAEVALFATHRTVVNMGRMISGQITLAAWPELTALEVRGGRGMLLRAHRSLAKVNGWVVGVMLLAFLPMAQPIYSAWTLGKLTVDGWTMGLLMAQTVLWGFWRSGATLLSSTNKQGRLVPLLVANAGAGILLALLLMPSLGIRGAALGGLLGDLLLASWAVPLAATRAVGDTLLGYLREVVPVLGLALGVPALLAGALYAALPWTAARVTLVPALFAAASLWFFWKLLEPGERAMTEHIARRLLARVGFARKASS